MKALVPLAADKVHDSVKICVASRSSLNHRVEAVRQPQEARRVNQVTEKVIGCAIEVHKHLGPGLLESAYEECTCYEMTEEGLAVRRQVPLPVISRAFFMPLRGATLNEIFPLNKGGGAKRQGVVGSAFLNPPGQPPEGFATA